MPQPTGPHADSGGIVLGDLLPPQAGDRVAVWDAGREWTYAAIDEQVARLCQGLRTHGFGPQTRLATMLPNRAEHLVVHLAAFRLGIPLVRLNPSYTAAQAGYCLRHVEPAGVIGDVRTARVRSEIELPSCLKFVWTLGVPGESEGSFEELLDAGEYRECPEHPSDATATISFTSGTTARPKGVVHSRRAVRWAVSKSLTLLRHGPDDVTVVRAPLCQQVGLLIQSLPTLCSGGRIELLQGPPVPGYAAALQRSPSKTMLLDAPTVLMELFRYPHIASLDFSQVRWLIAGGDFVPERLRVMARHLVGQHVSTAYGLTEVGMVACRVPADVSRAEASVGALLIETEVSIEASADGDGHEPRRGQILARSESQMSGYFRLPELTGSVLLSEGWVATGDHGAQTHDGHLLLYGRLKEMIVRDAMKISPLEVEAVLLSHSAVAQAGVVGVSDDVHGERVVAFAILRENFVPRPSAEDLRNLAAERLAPYMVPEEIRFVKQIPLQPSGKVDRARLKMLAEIGAWSEDLI